MPNPLPPDTEMLEGPEGDIGLSPPIGRAAPIRPEAGLGQVEPGGNPFEASQAPQKPNLTRDEFLAKHPIPARGWLPRHLQTPAERAQLAQRKDRPLGPLAQ
jgi:hypothetical protein